MKRGDPNEEPDNDPTWMIALKILRYLADNPNASDTIDGILEWWLLKQTIVEELRVVQRAVDSLLERNLIVAVETADGRQQYHLNVDRIEESRRLIHEAELGADR